MEHWGIYIAYGWLATIIWAFVDAVQAIRKGPAASATAVGDLQPQLATTGITDVTDGAIASTSGLSEATEATLIHEVAA
ncbi:MAG: hypothetical protein ABSD63_16835 [Candidatus Korobacteraceae bacterium]|jgi:hypothetical protein